MARLQNPFSQNHEVVGVGVDVIVIQCEQSLTGSTGTHYNLLVVLSFYFPMREFRKECPTYKLRFTLLQHYVYVWTSRLSLITPEDLYFLKLLRY